ncbi:type II secretion system protein [bacterium]|nr:type II secretion system protein [bacterium]
MPTRTLRQRGYSLVEMVIAAALASIITLILASLLSAQFRICRQSALRLNLQHEQLWLKENLRKDVFSTSGAGISIESTGLGLALQPLVDVTFQGVARYSTEDLVIYRWQSNQRLQRLQWQRKLPFALSAPPVRLSLADWSNLTSPRPLRSFEWSYLQSARFSGEMGAGQVTQRIWLDATWTTTHGPWAIRSCLFTRQNS